MNIAAFIQVSQVSRLICHEHLLGLLLACIFHYLIMEALRIGKSVHLSYTIGYVKRLYKLLADTTFFGNPQLAQLRMALP